MLLKGKINFFFKLRKISWESMKRNIVFPVSRNYIITQLLIQSKIGARSKKFLYNLKNKRKCLLRYCTEKNTFGIVIFDKIVHDSLFFLNFVFWITWKNVNLNPPKWWHFDEKIKTRFLSHFWWNQHTFMNWCKIRSVSLIALCGIIK